MKNETRYFSMFTGVGGFELGFEAANALSIASRNESRRDEKDSRSIKPELLASEQSFSQEGIMGSIDGSENGRGEVNKERINEDGKGLVTEKGKGFSPENGWEDEQPDGCNDKRTFTCIGMSEFNKYSSQVLKYRFPNIKNWGDCTKINPEDLPDFDMLCGGFPCQAFSIAGKRRGFEDIRGTMFFEVARILKVKRPKTILLENVKGLLNHDNGETFRVILQTLDELGYEVQWMVLNSKFFGVPQNRERVLIIGSLRGECRPEILPFNAIGMGAKNPAVCLTQRGYGSQRNGTYVASDSETKIRRLTPIECERLQGFPDNWTEYGINENGERIKMSDAQRYKQMGNAVTTNVIAAVGERLLNG